MINYFFVTDKKQYVVPASVIMEARKIFGMKKYDKAELAAFDKAFADRRSKVHKHIKQWALSNEKEQSKS